MNWAGTSHRIWGWPAERPRAILGIARLGFWPAPRERLEESATSGGVRSTPRWGSSTFGPAVLLLCAGGLSLSQGQHGFDVGPEISGLQALDQLADPLELCAAHRLRVFQLDPEDARDVVLHHRPKHAVAAGDLCLERCHAELEQRGDLLCIPDDQDEGQRGSELWVFVDRVGEEVGQPCSELVTARVRYRVHGPLGPPPLLARLDSLDEAIAKQALYGVVHRAAPQLDHEVVAALAHQGFHLVRVHGALGQQAEHHEAGWGSG